MCVCVCVCVCVRACRTESAVADVHACACACVCVCFDNNFRLDFDNHLLIFSPGIHAHRAGRLLIGSDIP